MWLKVGVVICGRGRVGRTKTFYSKVTAFFIHPHIIQYLNAVILFEETSQFLFPKATCLLKLYNINPQDFEYGAHIVEVSISSFACLVYFMYLLKICK